MEGRGHPLRGYVLTVVAWAVVAPIAAVLAGWASIPPETELGSYHDPNAMEPVLGGLTGFVVAVPVACAGLLRAFRQPRVIATAGISMCVAMVVALPVAVLSAFLAAYGGLGMLVVLIPVLAVVAVPVRAITTRGMGSTSGTWPPPPPPSPLRGPPVDHRLPPVQLPPDV